MDEVKTSIRSKYAGGPHNLGDPDDKFLRKIEKDVLIAEKVREKARKEKCAEEVKEFSKCCKEASFLMPFKCKQENTVLLTCLGKWFHDPTLREECTQEYLEERSEYRRTGINKNKYKR
ncbi:COX assembly mitochondrial protein homolog [Lasioglossum baleicum]|uniref:COX assembly mitochondrial protein homolog n=1 Tax=Lasioglossum baleicum TaxID=434251 RepID=UPI003FCD51C6